MERYGSHAFICAVLSITFVLIEFRTILRCPCYTSCFRACKLFRTFPHGIRRILIFCLVGGFNRLVPAKTHRQAIQRYGVMLCRNLKGGKLVPLLSQYDKHIITNHQATLLLPINLPAKFKFYLVSRSFFKLFRLALDYEHT